MKRSLLLLLCLLPMVAWAQRGGQTVTLNLRQATASQVLDALKSATTHEFFYRVNDVSDVPQRDYYFTNVPISQVMNHMTRGSGVQWSMRGNTVTISRRAGAEQPPATGTISGRVTGDGGQALQGASVVILGTNRGTSTDANGHWSIGGVAGQTVTVRISFMGMRTAEQQVTVGRAAATQLQPATIETEAVVVRTGLIDRADFSGSASTFKAEDLQKVGSTNIFQALSNLDPSLAMVANMEFGSDPNRMPEIELRGAAGFPISEGDAALRRTYQSNPNQPLFILNGFETSLTRVFDLDMQRVESVTILKDAAAKAIYGAKAANGVVVIETKRRAGGEVVVTYRGSADITMPDLTSYDLANSLEKLQVEKLSGMYSTDQVGRQNAFDELYQQRLNDALSGVNTDWLSKPLRTGVGTKHSLSVELAESALSFLGDVSYNDIAGAMKGSARKTLAGNMELQYRKAGKFLLRNAMGITSNKNIDSPYGTFREYADMNPYNAPYDADGNLVKEFVGVDTSQGNPLYNAHLGTSLRANYLNFFNNFYAEYYPLEGMMARLRVGVETQRDEGNRFYPGDHTMFSGYNSEEDELRRGSFEHNVGRKNNLSGDLTLQYNKKLAEKHMLMSNLVFSMSQSNSHEVNYKAEGFPSAKMNDMMYARAYAKDSKPTGWESIGRDMAFTGVVSYSFDDRFLADATLRGSASSQYSPAERWGAFWSLGAAWNIHNEKFAGQWQWLDQFKLRASVGSTGNQNIESNAHMVTYRYYTDQFYNGQRPYVGSSTTQAGAYIMRLANEDLRWEQELQTNVGFDARFWNRLTVVADLYLSNITDKVVDFTVPSATGYSMVKENVGTIENKGFEARLTYRVVDRPDLFLNITGAVAGNQNKIKKLSDAMQHFNKTQDALVDNRDGGGRWRPVLKYVEGGSMTALWAVPSLGINPANGREIYVRPDGTTTYTYSSAYQQIVGDSRPKVRGNFGIDGEWKGFGFNVTMLFLGGGDYYNSTLIQRVENADISKNVDRRVFAGRWTSENRDAPFKRLEPYTDSKGDYIAVPYTQATSRFVQKLSELDIAAVSIYYDFGRLRKIKDWGFERLRLAANMNDIHKFSTVKVERGTDYPFARTMSLSLTAEF